MKLTVIGGASVRSPLLMPALARRQATIGLDEVWLMDQDQRKIDLLGPLSRYTAEHSGASFRLVYTTDTRAAIEGADAVITTIRSGGEGSRVTDERIALEHGVLGQETTGPGGFSMALRSIPAMTEIARTMRELAPDAWLFNFTNPAGLVAQGLTAQFPDMKIVGICDTPMSMIHDVASVYKKDPSEIPVRFAGLNHLSWLFSAEVDGRNVVPDVIADREAVTRLHTLSLFDWDLLRLLGVIPNEYLYFYYYRERAVNNIKAIGETRGEQVFRLGQDLMNDLERIDPGRNPDGAWKRYQQYRNTRRGTYMSAETTQQRKEDEAQKAEPQEPQGQEGEGYAGVALNILTAARNGHGPAPRIIANVPNRGAIEGLRDDDVVEVVCEVGSDGVRPVPQGALPDDAFALVQAVKVYERYTVDAILQRSRDLAVEALMNHPLVGSYSLARPLVDAYLNAYADEIGEWPAS